MAGVSFPTGRRLARALMLLALVGCDGTTSVDGGPAPATATLEELSVKNPVRWFEIPVNDMDRAVRFYEAVFGHALQREVVDGYDMALLPRNDGAPGASGALARGDVYVPSKQGPILYFDVPDIDPVLERAHAHGATVLYPKKAIGQAGFVAEIEDSEGNRIGLHATKD